MPDSRPRSVKNEISEPSTPIMQMFLSMIGVRPMSEQEYLAKMKRTRDAYLKRIAELELQRGEEKVLRELEKS
jgi:hypothetical protein